MLVKTICRIKKTGLMGTVRVEAIERGVETTQGCIGGGVDVLKISYTNNNAGEVIHALKEKFGDQLLVGVGTVLDPTIARLATVDEAEFIIAPTFNEEVQEMTNLYQIPYTPGCTSYMEMIEILKAGVSFVRASLVSSYYGLDLAKVFKAPCLRIPILAGSGANFGNLHTWFENGVNSVGLGRLLTEGSSVDITENVRGLRTIVEESRKAD